MKDSRYSLFSNIKYMLSLVWDIDKSLLITRLLFIPISLLNSLINTATPAILVSVVLYYKNIENIIIAIAILFGVWMLIDMASNYVKTRYLNISYYLTYRMLYDFYAKLYDMDICRVLEPEIDTKLPRVHNAMSGTKAPAEQFIACFFDILVYIPGIVTFTIILGSLNPWLIILVICTTILNCIIIKLSAKTAKKLADNRVPYSRQYQYFKKLAGDFKFTKYIRLNNLMPLFDTVTQKLTNTLTSEFKTLHRNNHIFTILGFLIVLIRDLTGYSYLICRAVSDNGINAAKFIFYFAVIAELATYFKNTFDKVPVLSQNTASVSEYRSFFDIKNTLKREGGITVDLSKPPTIEFCNVSYRYSSSDTDMLKNISFIIKPGEKIAFTGLNDSGKTAITMLMCGILLPTEGEILINGYPLSAYNRDNLYSLFSLVPQKACILPLSVAENVALTESSLTDTDKLNKCLNTVGLSHKSTVSNATTLSDGEKQKLLLARALYRNAPVLILDEPTSSLDPITEDMIYRQYNELTGGCTSVFISHRLASTRFCDRIFMLEDGHIIEDGSHDELIKASGRYAEIFSLQSQYYSKEVNVNA